MLSEEQKILDEYERYERVLTPAAINAIPWNDARKFPLDDRFLATLYYMRDVEKLTDMYYKELLKTPTTQDPVIAKFMERWRTEESVHGDLLNRFLEEIGQPTDSRWFEKVQKRVPSRYRFTSHVIAPIITRPFGDRFVAVHMVWGAINEYSTMNGYARLKSLAQHPVLDQLLTAVMAEEARHARFYAQIAKIRLSQSEYVQKIARFFVDAFWTPVGEGAKPMRETAEVIKTLFSGNEGLSFFEARVSRVIQNLPGFADCTKLNRSIVAATR